jgi:glycosyltransferase involved in cell wall biosynthesis
MVFSKKESIAKSSISVETEKTKSDHYIDVQNGLDYLVKLVRYRFCGYHFHIHTNGQAVKGPILCLMANLVSVLSGERASLTFHGGIEQLYFPKKNAGKMFWIIYLNLLLPKLIVCNNAPVKKRIEHYGPFIAEEKVKAIPAFSVQYLEYKPVELPERIEKFIKGKKHIVLCYIVLRNGFFVDTTVQFLKECEGDVGFILSGIGKPEDEEVAGYVAELKSLERKGVVLAIEDLDHDAFMTLLKKCSLYLRTPVSDGVASSVLEALTQEVPVVASENGRRPKGVITYDPKNPEDLAEKIEYVVSNRERIAREIVKPRIEDTLEVEISTLQGCFE